MAKQGQVGVLKNLSPAEVDVVKGQVALMLNYSRQGGSVAKIPQDILSKIEPKDREQLLQEIATLFKK